MVILALPGLLSGSLRISPLLSSVAPSLDPHDVFLTQIAISAALVGVGVTIWWRGSHSTVRWLIIIYIGLMTVFLSASLLTLVVSLPAYGPAQAELLLKDALVVWGMTVLTFSLWYWLIDSGWPESMGGRDTSRPDFLFPQQANSIEGWASWTPRYLDYLHLAFNTSTAFSPTDVLPLSHRGKILMTIQASLSLIVMVTVAARAINILAAG